MSKKKRPGPRSSGTGRDFDELADDGSSQSHNENTPNRSAQDGSAGPIPNQTSTGKSASAGNDFREGTVIESFRDPIRGDVIIQFVALSDGTTAVDLECAEARAFARQLLPPPLEVRDRPGKPKSRWIYRTDGGPVLP